MKYYNPVIKGCYPDPSVIRVGTTFFLVCSSFQYFPAIPIFTSKDLVNWKQIGHVFTRESQAKLKNVPSSGGIFAPTIRFWNGRFYVVVNHNTIGKNYYVYTDDIYGEWSEPIEVDQKGIDPSLLFDEGHAYFISNGIDEDGENCIFQCEIDIETGKKLTESKSIWKGMGGRFLESPHMYKIGDYYYLIAAEGGTEYGHMVVSARSKNIWGTFEANLKNPVLTNRDKAPFLIQGIGHGELIKNTDGLWYMICLGFRQNTVWSQFHSLGREVFLLPIYFHQNGWFTAGHDGTCDISYEIPGSFTQNIKEQDTLFNTNPYIDYCYLRNYCRENYMFYHDKLILKGSKDTLNDDMASPTFTALRLKDFNTVISSDVKIQEITGFYGRTGITLYMCEKEHYDLYIEKEHEIVSVALMLNIGGICHVHRKILLNTREITLYIKTNEEICQFYMEINKSQVFMGEAFMKYLSSEVSGGFTGTMIGFFAEGDITGIFKNICIDYLYKKKET